MIRFSYAICLIFVPTFLLAEAVKFTPGKPLSPFDHGVKDEEEVRDNHMEDMIEMLKFYIGPKADDPAQNGCRQLKVVDPDATPHTDRDRKGVSILGQATPKGEPYPTSYCRLLDEWDIIPGELGEYKICLEESEKYDWPLLVPYYEYYVPHQKTEHTEVSFRSRYNTEDRYDTFLAMSAEELYGGEVAEELKSAGEDSGSGGGEGEGGGHGGGGGGQYAALVDNITQEFNRVQQVSITNDLGMKEEIPEAILKSNFEQAVAKFMPELKKFSLRNQRFQNTDRGGGVFMESHFGPTFFADYDVIVGVQNLKTNYYSQSKHAPEMKALIDATATGRKICDKIEGNPIHGREPMGYPVNDMNCMLFNYWTHQGAPRSWIPKKNPVGMWGSEYPGSRLVTWFSNLARAIPELAGYMMPANMPRSCIKTKQRTHGLKSIYEGLSDLHKVVWDSSEFCLPGLYGEAMPGPMVYDLDTEYHTQTAAKMYHVALTAIQSAFGPAVDGTRRIFSEDGAPVMVHALQSVDQMKTTDYESGEAQEFLHKRNMMQFVESRRASVERFAGCFAEEPHVLPMIQGREYKEANKNTEGNLFVNADYRYHRGCPLCYVPAPYLPPDILL